MKTILISALFVSGFAVPAFAQERTQRQETKVEKFRRLPAERQDKMRERFRTFQQMSQEERAQLRERFQRLQSRTAEQEPQRLERLRQLRGQLHRPERGRFEANPQAFQEGRVHALRLAEQQRGKLLERLLQAGKIDRSQADRMKRMPLPEFFAAVRAIVHHGAEGRPAPQRPGAGRQGATPDQDSGRKPERGNGGERPSPKRGGSERRDGV